MFSEWLSSVGHCEVQSAVQSEDLLQVARVFLERPKTMITVRRQGMKRAFVYGV